MADGTLSQDNLLGDAYCCFNPHPPGMADGTFLKDVFVTVFTPVSILIRRGWRMEPFYVIEQMGNKDVSILIRRGWRMEPYPPETRRVEP